MFTTPGEIINVLGLDARGGAASDRTDVERVRLRGVGDAAVV